ncbi:hypothetical protein HQ487_01220 [Candidatus Uhrbacteria bacterium]|nr:hypothetical protein [Candidatus Uhrbacteria bacterium]
MEEYSTDSSKEKEENPEGLKESSKQFEYTPTQNDLDDAKAYVMEVQGILHRISDGDRSLLGLEAQFLEDVPNALREGQLISLEKNELQELAMTAIGNIGLLKDAERAIEWMITGQNKAVTVNGRSRVITQGGDITYALDIPELNAAKRRVESALVVAEKRQEKYESLLQEQIRISIGSENGVV